MASGNREAGAGFHRGTSRNCYLCAPDIAQESDSACRESGGEVSTGDIDVDSVAS